MLSFETFFSDSAEILAFFKAFLGFRREAAKILAFFFENNRKIHKKRVLHFFLTLFRREAAEIFTPFLFTPFLLEKTVTKTLPNFNDVFSEFGR